MWQDAAVKDTIGTLADMMDTPPMGLLGVSVCGEDEEWKYFIAVSTTKAGGEFEEYIMLAATGAIFSGSELICPFRSWRGVF